MLETPYGVVGQFPCLGSSRVLRKVIVRMLFSGWLESAICSLVENWLKLAKVKEKKERVRGVYYR